MTMKPLAAEYAAEFGFRDGRVWDEVVGTFEDANLYQTWAYDGVRADRRRMAHMILRRNGAAVAAAQTRIMRVPGTRSGIAYVRWGPMWRSTGVAEDREVFRQAVRALRNELSQRLGLVVRLYPLAYRGRDDALARILEEEGYGLHETGRTDRTLIVDLAPTVQELRAALDQKWRNCLNRAERNGLEVISGEEGHLFDAIAAMHGEMTVRKGLEESSDVGHLKMVQNDLPAGLKLRAIVCRRKDELCAGAIFATVGTTGLYVRGATSDAGLKSNGSYIVQWTFVRWLKERGLQRYDLNGISPDGNPGTYHFKRGLAGKQGMDVEFLGRFQVADNPLSDWVVRAGERLRSRYQRMVGAAR